MRLTILAVALAGCLPLIAHGQQADEPKKDDTANAATVVIAGQAYNARREDTVTKIVVGRQELQRYGDASLSEALKHQASISIEGGAIRMRGLGEGYILVLVNGEKVPGVSIDSFAIDLVERVEILRAATAEYGTQGIAGTINLVLRQARTARQEMKADVHGQNDGARPFLSFQTADNQGNYAYSVNGSANDNAWRDHVDAVETGTDEHGRENLRRHSVQDARTRDSKGDFSIRQEWTRENKEKIVSQTFGEWTRTRGQAREQMDVQAGTAPNFVDTADRTFKENTAIYEELSTAFNYDSGLRLEVTGGAGGRAITDEFYRIGKVPSGALGIDRKSFLNTRERSGKINGKFVIPISGGGAVVAGWNAIASRVSEFNQQRESLSILRPAMNFDERYTAVVNNLAFYAQYEWELSSSWSAYGGLRWEGLDTHSREPATELGASRSRVWSPLFQTLLKLSEKGQLRFAVTRTYRAPPTADLIPTSFISTDNSPVAPDYRGNPTLLPELAWNTDLSYEYYWSGQSMFSASLFDKSISNASRWHLALEAGRWVSTPANSGKARIQGVELEAKCRLTGIDASLWPLDLRATATIARSKADGGSGMQGAVDGQLPLKASLEANYVGSAKWEAGAYFAYRREFDMQVAPNERKSAGAGRELNLFSTYKVDAKTTLRTSVNNLLHQDAETGARYAADGGYRQRVALARQTAVLRISYERRW